MVDHGRKPRTYAPVAQRIERLPPEQEAAGSSPAGRTKKPRRINRFCDPLRLAAFFGRLVTIWSRALNALPLGCSQRSLFHALWRVDCHILHIRKRGGGGGGRVDWQASRPRRAPVLVAAAAATTTPPAAPAARRIASRRVVRGATSPASVVADRRCGDAWSGRSRNAESSTGSPFHIPFPEH